MRTYLAPIAILIILISFVVFGISSFYSQEKLGEPKISVSSKNIFSKDAIIIYENKDLNCRIIQDGKFYFEKYENKSSGDNEPIKIFDSVYVDNVDTIYSVKSPQANYLYFQFHVLGGSMGNFGKVLAMLNLNTYEEYYYQYDYEPNGRNIALVEITPSGNVENQIGTDCFACDFLYRKLRLIQERYDFDAMEQGLFDFVQLNEEVLTKVDAGKCDDCFLTFKRTSTKLFDPFEKKFYMKNTEYSPLARAQNQNYVVDSYFKSGVLCYDKKSREYFAIWMPEARDSDFTIDEIKFLAPHVVEFKHYNWGFVINLISGEIEPFNED